MEIGINDLEFDDDVQYPNANNPQEPSQTGDEGNEGEIKNPVNPSNPDNNNNQINSQEDIINILLKDKNIQDPSKIKFEDEEGNIEERDWKSLSLEEQLNILKTPNESSDNSLEDEEIELINQLRLSQMSPSEFIEYVKQQGASEYAQSLEKDNTSIDQLSDDELFILDLQSRIEDITDEEATIALDKAKQDENLFQKQVKGIREEYKRIEEDRKQRELLEQQEEDSKQFEQFKDSILDSIQSLNKIGSLDVDMEEDDMNEIANFILSSDSAGVNYFSKALNDPQTLVRMAWFALKGEEAIDSITQYFTEEIKKVSQSRYEQGLKDGSEKNKKNQEKKTTVVINDTTPISYNQTGEISINDLD